MASADQFFDEKVVQGIEALYKNRDTIEKHRFALDALSLRPGERVVDIGCGPGFLTRKIADAVGPGGEVLALDNNEMILELARQRLAGCPQVRLESADATRLPAEGDTFDAAVCRQVLEYVPDVDRAIGEIYRVLRPGGRAVVVSVDWDSIAWNSTDQARMRRVLTAFEEHCAHLDLPRMLAPKLRSAGFQVRDQQVNPYFNTAFDADNFSFHLVRIIKPFVPGRNGLSEAEVAEWEADLQSVADRGEYFFCLNQFLFEAVKPDGQ